MNGTTRTLLRFVAAICIGLAALISVQAHAQTKVRVGAQTIGDYIAAYLAQEHSIYRKHGLDVTVEPITVSTLAAASLMSRSLDVATFNLPDMIQAVENGIDLVAFTGIAELAARGGTRSGVVVQPDSNIRQPADFVGRKVGISALGSLLHILFQKYLMDNGVDPQKVVYVEIPIPSHFDVMKNRSVDGVVTADPMMARILKTGTGTEVVAFGETVPPHTLSTAVVTTRDFAQKNPEVIARFRAAWQEATDLAMNEPETARAAIVKYLKLPEPVAATLDLPLTLTTRISVDKFQWWQDVMREQRLIPGKADMSKHILP